MTIERVFSKKNCIAILSYFTLLLGFRYYQVRTILYLIEFIIAGLSIIATCIFNRKVILYFVILFVSVMMQLDHSKMYVALVFYIVSAFIRRKYLVPLTAIYHCNTLIIMLFDKITLSVNIVLYLSVCVVIFLLIYFYPKTITKKLNLTHDEQLILDELAKGKLIKEVDIFSKNTITNKLKSACNRNNLMDKNELIYIYKSNCD